MRYRRSISKYNNEFIVGYEIQDSIEDEYSKVAFVIDSTFIERHEEVKAVTNRVFR